jgi:hypothetical protein
MSPCRVPFHTERLPDHCRRRRQGQERATKTGCQRYPSFICRLRAGSRRMATFASALSSNCFNLVRQGRCPLSRFRGKVGIADNTLGSATVRSRDRLGRPHFGACLSTLRSGSSTVVIAPHVAYGRSRRRVFRLTGRRRRRDRLCGWRLATYRIVDGCRARVFYAGRRPLTNPRRP